MGSGANSSATASSRACRSKLALAIVAVLLLATFSPVSWFRGQLPRWSSPANSLDDWAECRGESSRLKAEYFFHGPGAKEFEALLSTVPEVVIGYPTEEEWERMASKKQKSGTTPASSEFDDLFIYPTAPTVGPTAEPVQAARDQPPIAD
jgi:hypothetical protein